MNRHNLTDGESFAPIPQQQAMQAPFQWGSGGRRMTPEQIAREREIAEAMSAVDYSPIQSPWQGLARLGQNIMGGLRERDASKAERANLDYSDQILQSLMNPGGVPSASGAPGVASPAPGANAGQFAAIIGDPYASPQVKALAKRQLDMADFETKQRLQSQYGEQPEIVRLATIARDQSQPPEVRAAAEGRIKALNDPEIVIPGLPGGTYVGPRSGVSMAYGQAPVADAPDTLPPDFFDEGAPPVSAAPPPPDAAAMARARAEADAWMKLNGMVPR